jgi:hypothetical protein
MGMNYVKTKSEFQGKCDFFRTLSRVRGSVANNNGFWIGWLDLLTPFF